MFEMGNRTIGKNPSNGEKKKAIPRDRVGNRSAFGFCESWGSSNWLIYQESDSISTESHFVCCSLKRALVWVRWVRAGLCKRGRINKELCINPFPSGGPSRRRRAPHCDTSAANSFFQSSVTCAVTGPRRPGFQTHEFLHCPKKGESSRPAQTSSSEASGCAGAMSRGH